MSCTSMVPTIIHGPILLGLETVTLQVGAFKSLQIRCVCRGVLCLLISSVRNSSITQIQLCKVTAHFPIDLFLHIFDLAKIIGANRAEKYALTLYSGISVTEKVNEQNKSIGQSECGAI